MSSPQLFDIDYYLSHNPDLQITVKKFNPALQKQFLVNHFFSVGRNEKRKHRFMTTPIPLKSFSALSTGGSITGGLSTLPPPAPKDSYKKLHRKEKVDIEHEHKIINKLIQSYRKKYVE